MKKGKKTKSVSIDELALMVGRGFSEAKGETSLLRSEVGSLRTDLEKFKKETENNFHKVRHDILSMADSFVPRSEFETRMLKMHNAIQHQDERLSKFVDHR